jgi:PAS domain S-box-containing protein
MQFKTRFRITFIFIIVASLIFGVSIFLSFLSLQRYKEAIKQSSFANNIMLLVFERRLLFDEYLLTGGERARQQWYGKQNALEKLLDFQLHAFTTPNSVEKELTTALQSKFEESKEIAREIVALEEADITNTLIQEKKNQLIGQLTIKVQEKILYASRLASFHDNHAKLALQNSIFLSSISASLFFLVLLTSFWIIWKNGSELEQAKSRDEEILSSIGDGVFAIDTNGRIILCNEVMAQLSGYTIQEAIGKPYQEIFKFTLEGEDTIKDTFILKALAGQKAKMENHTELVTRDGQRVQIADSAAPILSFTHQINGAVIVCRDVSREREVERLKTEFLNIAAHDLRTPAAAIKGYITMILDGEAGEISPKIEKLLNSAYTGNERLIHLVDTFLTVAKLEKGKIKIEPTQIQLNNVVDTCLIQFAQLGNQKQIHLLYQKVKLPPVFADEEKIIEVLTNILENAMKFTKEGSITISHEIRGNEVITHVRDTGIGIPPKDQKHIFEKFYAKKIDSTREGLGLGLYVCKLIIEASGGKIWVESTIGKGSVFSFSLPLYK